MLLKLLLKNQPQIKRMKQILSGYLSLELKLLLLLFDSKSTISFYFQQIYK